MSSSPPYFPARDSPGPAPGSPPGSPELRAPPVRLTDEASRGSFPDDSNSIDGVFPSPSTYTFDPEGSNSSFNSLPRPRRAQPPSPFVSNENSVFSAALSEDSEPLPEVSVRAEEPRAAEEPHAAEEPPAKIRRVGSPRREEEEGDGETCPICLESWATSGDHRLVALKCGHLFGARCVERWLRAQAQKDRSCPTCKSRAAMRDLRHIYARRLVAVDTAELSAAQRQVERLQAEKGRVELELQKSKIAHRACLQQLETLRSTMLMAQAEPPAARAWRFALEKNLEICKDGGCRVMTYNCRTYELYVSQKSTNNLFPGYGVRRVSCVDYKQGQFVHLHPKPIRDIAYSQPRDRLLSVGLDSSARVLERGVPGVTVRAGVQLWSCAWDRLRSDEFYVGGVGGFILQYDVRSPGAPLRRLAAPGDMSPVVSLCPTEYGLLSCHLNSCWLWGPGGAGPRALPVEGPFMSLSYDAQAQRALVSCRAGGGERARLAVCRLTGAGAGEGEEVTCAVEQTFAGSARSSVLSRAAWVRAGEGVWAAAHSESLGALQLHALGGARSLALACSEPALDVAAAAPGPAGDTLLAALSESRLRIYRALPAA